LVLLDAVFVLTGKIDNRPRNPVWLFCCMFSGGRIGYCFAGSVISCLCPFNGLVDGKNIQHAPNSFTLAHPAYYNVGACMSTLSMAKDVKTDNAHLNHFLPIHSTQAMLSSYDLHVPTQGMVSHNMQGEQPTGLHTRSVEELCSSSRLLSVRLRNASAGTTASYQRHQPASARSTVLGRLGDGCITHGMIKDQIM
jgi:hypothetical protein